MRPLQTEIHFASSIKSESASLLANYVIGEWIELYFIQTGKLWLATYAPYIIDYSQGDFRPNSLWFRKAFFHNIFSCKKVFHSITFWLRRKSEKKLVGWFVGSSAGIRKMFLPYFQFVRMGCKCRNCSGGINLESTILQKRL